MNLLPDVLRMAMVRVRVAERRQVRPLEAPVFLRIAAPVPVEELLHARDVLIAPRLVRQVHVRRKPLAPGHVKSLAEVEREPGAAGRAG